MRCLQPEHTEPQSPNSSLSKVMPNQHLHFYYELDYHTSLNEFSVFQNSCPLLSTFGGGGGGINYLLFSIAQSKC